MADVRTGASGEWFVSVELHTVTRAAPPGWSVGRPVPSPSADLLRRAQGRGLLVAVVASDRSFYGSEFVDLVDTWLECDSRDDRSILRAIAGLSGPVRAVTSLVDTFVGPAARVAAALGLVGTDPQAPALVRDKAAARRALAVSGVADVRWGVGDAHDPAIESPIGYPCVAKPVDGAASWDVELVADREQTLSLARRHAARSYPRGVTPQHRLLFEEYVPGPLFSAEGIVGPGGRPYILGWSSRVMGRPPSFAELALTFSTDEPTRGANHFVVEVLAALGYDFGPFHLEVILGPEGLRLVELNPRFVGSGAHVCLELVLGVSPLELLLTQLLDEPLPTTVPSGAATQMYVVAAAEGLVSRTAAPYGLAGLPGIAAAASFASVGDRVVAATSSSDYLGWVISVGSDPDDAVARAGAGVNVLTPVVVGLEEAPHVSVGAEAGHA